MLPADERLHADDVTGQHVYLRLIQQSEFPLLDGSAQVEEQIDPLANVVVQAVGEESKGSPLLRLGAIQSCVGIRQKGFRIAMIMVTARNPDAGSGMQLGSCD